MLVTMKKSARRLLLVATVAVIMAVITAVAYASTTYYIGGNSWITCGTSAGDLQWDCPEGGGPCTSDPANDARAQQFCSLPPGPDGGFAELEEPPVN
jgi:hypothetical protein